MTEHRLHPFAALRVLRKTLVLYLVPLLRVLFERNWAALRAALRQDLILFLLVCALSWVILHASSWSLDESGTFCLHWKLLFRFDRTVRGASLAALTIERPFYYRLAGASRVTLYPVGEPKQRTLTLCLRLGHVLQEFAALHGDVVLGAFPHGGQHRNGHSQLQGTGEVHHEHGQGLGDIPGDQIGQGRTAQGIGHQLVRQMGGAGLCGGLELFGILNHFHDSVVPSAALGLLHPDDAFALLGYGARIDEAADPLGHGLGFTGHGGLVYHGLAGNHLAVQGNQAAGADNDPVPNLHLPHGHQHLGSIRLHPHGFHLQGHGPGQISYGFFVRPLLQNLAQPEHEHDRPGGIEVPPDHGNGHGCGIQHGNAELAVLGFLMIEQNMADDKLYYRLGQMNMGGIGTAVNLPKAKRYFEKAAKLDNPDALYGLGKLFLRKDSEYYDPNKAVDCLLQAAQKGHEFSAYALGKLFLKGDEVPKNVGHQVHHNSGTSGIQKDS